MQLIDATLFWSPMRRSHGDKRREIPPERAADMLRLFVDFDDGAARTVAKDGKEEERVVSRVYPTTRFGYRRITVERPLRLNFQASPERIARLGDQRGFQNLAKSRKRGDAGAREEAEGRARQQAILALLEGMPDALYMDPKSFLAELTSAAEKVGVRLPATVRNAILAALAKRDEKAEICRGEDGAPEPDSELRDTERVPLPEGEDPVGGDGVPESVRAFFVREVLPHVPDAWIDTARCDQRDGRVGAVGYEINFNRYFYRYTPPRPLAEIETDI